MVYTSRQIWVVVFASMLLAACGDKYSPYGGSDQPTNIKIGKPYSVKGEEYTPKYEPDYVEEGMASWYGPGFHGRKTASGERYDQNEMTAAHRTLPMPSIAKVTLLKTGKTIKVRVNDRGPFSSKRIIDLSKASAKEIGLIPLGVSRVRVEYLPDETEEYLQSLDIPVPDYMKDRKEVTNADIARQPSSSNQVAIKRSKFEANGSYANLEPSNEQKKPSFWDSLFGAKKTTKSSSPSYSGNSSYAVDTSKQVTRKKVPMETVDAAVVDSIAVSDSAPMDLMTSSDLPPVDNKPVTSSGFAKSQPETISVSDSYVAKPLPAAKPVQTANNDKDFETLLRGPMYGDDKPVTSAERAVAAKALVSAPAGKYVEKPFKVAEVTDTSTETVKMTTSAPAVSLGISAPKAPSAPKVDASVAMPASGSYFVQAGSFSEKANAHKQAASLKALGRADVKEAQVSGMTIYRVVVGPEASQDAASELHRKVVDKGFADARVIKN